MLERISIFGVIFALTCLTIFRFSDAELPQAEVNALQQIVTTMGSRYWRFNNNGASCQIEAVGLTPLPPLGSEGRIDCECNNGNDTNCHVIRIILKGYSLPGILPPDLARLTSLQEIDFAYNYLRGPIPLEWARTRLSSISVLANRLSGEIPRALGNLTTLTYLALEANQFSGIIPPELGSLINLRTLMLSSNNFSGTLPVTFVSLTNLTDFRINDNNFRGQIPEFIPNLRQLTRLEMLSSGLVGPIPSNISQLDRLTDLRISDLNGSVQEFPSLSTSTGLLRLVLRNCNLSGQIPAYIWNLRDIEMLDFSFNKLVGGISNDIRARSLKFMFLTHNRLSGDVPDSVLKDGSSIDLSYNNFTWQGPEEPTCRPNMNLYINMFRSSSTASTLKETIPCIRDFKCPRYDCSLHVNTGGNDITVTENNSKIMYEGDASVDGGSSRLYISENNWGFSSTGDFMDDDNYQNTRYVESVQSSANISGLYSTARLSPLSLTYFHYCLENGNYTVTLHFAEIQFVNDSTFNSLGRRIFDVYIQESLIRKDFNIEDEAGGEQRPLVRHFNASVENNYLEIRFYWAGKGTTRIPSRGAYGPLVSAISVNPTFKTCSTSRKKLTIYVVGGVVAFCIVLIVLIVLWWKGFFNCKKRKREGFDDLELQTVSFSLKQIRAATKNFDFTNKIGEGGFGPVYKGFLPDGTVIAVKQLSSRSRQGNREFLNEIGMISCLQHPNLVKLHGCCIEGGQLLVVYEYMENNSLASALFGTQKSKLMLDWETRFKICIGIARGLAFLHEESRIKIVHRDIKATNVLLDGDLNPKISDFGLARLNEEDKTHVSTRVAGTIGYMAPEYALWGHLSDKVDVYSFGVVALEIVSGENNARYMPIDDFICLLDWACHLQQKGNLSEVFDKSPGLSINTEEAERMVKVALLCTNASPSLRPLMSEAVSMLEGRLEIPILPLERNTYHEDLRFRAIREFHTEYFTITAATSRTDMCSSSTPLTTVATTSTSLFEETHKDNNTPFTMP